MFYHEPISPARNPQSRIPTHILPLRTPFGLQIRAYHHERNKGPETECVEFKLQEREVEATSSSASLPTASDPDLPHLTPSQTVHMTQIHEKPVTKRQATAACLVYFSNSRPWELLRGGQATKKGDVFSVARIAGIMAAKKTPDIVPLCHPGIGITGVEVDVRLVDPVPEEKAKNGFSHGAMRVVATVSCLGRTGVEMEAMTSTMSAALTVYDMLKAVDKGMVISDVKLLEKKGGKSGHWIREKEIGDQH